MATAVGWFPVAGGMIGAAVGGIGAAAWYGVPPLLAGTLAVAAGLLITGAFHEDGLGDVADAFGGGWTVERRLEILKDSRHGTYGVAAICTSIAVRMVALGSMPGPAALFASAVAAHAISRASAVGLMASMRLATHPGLGTDYGRSTSPRVGVVAGASGVAIAAVAVGWWALPLAVSGVASAALIGALAQRKISGVSGDVLGACQQVAECAGLVVLCGLAARHQLSWR